MCASHHAQVRPSSHDCIAPHANIEFWAVLHSFECGFSAKSRVRLIVVHKLSHRYGMKRTHQPKKCKTEKQFKVASQKRKMPHLVMDVPLIHTRSKAGCMIIPSRGTCRA